MTELYDNKVKHGVDNMQDGETKSTEINMEMEIESKSDQKKSMDITDTNKSHVTVETDEKKALKMKTPRNLLTVRQ